MFLGRVVGPNDPQWLDTDRGYALAWKQERAATCSCGTRADEWEADREAYVGATHYCRGCDIRSMQQAALPTDPHGRAMPGFHAYLEPREAAEARERAKTPPIE